MNKKELKKLLKPLVKECINESIHEALFDSGIVTNVVAEVMKGMNLPRLVESAPRTVPQPVVLGGTPRAQPVPQMASVVQNGHSMEAELQLRRQEHSSGMNETRNRMEAKFNKTLGINPFENTTPILAEAANSQGPLGGLDPSDPGINLASIPGLSTLNFSSHIKLKE